MSSVGDTTMKRFDLMQGINARGTFLVTKACLPHLRKAANPHVLMLSPPLDLEPQWFAGHAAYAIAKFGMSLCVLGFAEEFKGDGIAVNALWPRTTIATSAIRNVLGGEAVVRMSRTPDIVADAAYLVFLKPSRSFTGNFLIDDSFLYEEGAVRDFAVYSVEPGCRLHPISSWRPIRRRRRGSTSLKRRSISFLHWKHEERRGRAGPFGAGR